MTKGSKPFSAERYQCPSTQLVRLQPNQAGLIAGQLVRMDPWRTLGYSQTGLYTYLVQDDPALHCYVLKNSERLAGMVTVRHPWLFGPHLELLAVFPTYQGRGIGREVLEWLQGEALPSRNLWVVVSAFNTGARRFYQRHGFREIASLADLIVPGSDEHLLRKVLG
jgi:diamine N-acetyltransferase